MHEFSDKVVVITGGNSGIGYAIAKKFDQEGAKLSLFGRDQKRLDATAASLKKAVATQGDVCKIPDLDRLYQVTEKHYGKIDVLIANAGISGRRHLKDVDEKFFDDIVNTNYKGVFFTVQRSLPHLNNGASIILISSIVAHIAWPSHSVYSSTKAAVSYLAKSFAADLIDRKIRVNAISPGFVDTPIFDELKKKAPEEIKLREKLCPMNRFAQAEKIADASLFLCSNRASYITGTDLSVDGGLRAIFRT